MRRTLQGSVAVVLALLLLQTIGGATTQASGGLSLTGFSPTSGPVGTQVTLSGTGFTSSDVVAFNGTNATTLHVNKAGTTLVTAVPAFAVTGPITVTDPSTGQTAGLPGTAFQVTTGLSTSPAKVWPGQRFTVAGSALTPDTGETLMLDAAVLGDVRTDANGNFAMPFNLPWTTTPGHHTISLTDATYGVVRYVLPVLSSWPMDGAVPTRTYANSAEQSLGAPHLSGLGKKFRTGFVPNVLTAPVVAGGLLYVGHESTLTAEDAITGALQWSFTANDLISSTPAVDSGVIYVASYDTNLYALGAADGHFIWRATLGVPESSPLVSKGVVYYGTDAGYVWALGAADGHFIWDYKTGGPVLSPPSIAKGIVYFGSQDGFIYALKASTGHFLWRYQTGTAEHAVSVSGGLAVTAAGGYIQAVNASTGAFAWSAGSGYLDGLWEAIGNGVVYKVSNHDTSIEALNLSDGSTLWNYPCSSPGPPSYADGVVYVTCGTHLLGFDAVNGGTPWTWTLPGAQDHFMDAPASIAGARVYFTSGTYGATNTDWVTCLGF